MNLFVSFLSGLLAAFSPCVVVLIPLVLYSFIKDKKKLLPFSLGFMMSYLLLAIAMQQLLSSPAQSGIKLGFGLLFISLGILSFLDRINPLDMKLFRNPFLLGLGFSLIVLASPCTIPFLGVIAIQDFSFVHIATFAIGLVMPAAVFTFFGSHFLSIAKKTSKIMHKLNRLMSVILIASGIYLGMSIQSFGAYDMYISASLLAVVFVILLRSFFIVNSKEDLLRPKNILLLISLVLVIISVVLHCKDRIVEQEAIFCGDPGCEHCSSCLYSYALAFGLGLGAIALASLSPHIGSMRSRDR